MIPISLKFKGIYSYQEEQFVDFERLTGAQLFGIFGAVGSGKSTILEAISFALYGETERLNKTDNRGYNMMNLKSDELFIEFAFKAGKNNKALYKFIVSGKRNSKKFEDVKTFSRNGYIKKKGDWEPILDNDVEDILGLSYQNFRRAIIIPQGRFQEFLKLKSKERTLMLKEIFGLERFELYEKVAAVKKDIDMEINEAEARLDQIGEAGEEFIKKDEKALSKQREEAEKIEKELKKVTDVQNEIIRTKKMQETVATAKKELDILKNEEAEFKGRTKIFTRYKKCKENFRDLFEQKERKEENIEEAEESIISDKDELESLDKKCKSAEKFFKGLKERYEKKDEILNRANDLRRMVDVKKIQKDKENSEKRMVAAAKELGEKRDKLEGIKKERGAVKKELAGEKKKAPESEDLLKVQEWFNEKEIREKSVNDSEEEIRKTSRELKNLNKEKDMLLSDKIINKYFSGKTSDKTFEKALGVLEEALSDIKPEIKTLENKMKPLELGQQMSKVASALHKGKPCPLCGAKEHPNPLKPGDITKRLKEEKDAFEKIQVRQSVIEETLNEIKGLHKQKTSLEKELKEEEANLKGLLSELKAHSKTFNFKDFSPSDKGILKDKIKANAAAVKKIEKLEQKLTQTEEKLERTEENVHECQLAHDGHKSDLKSAEARIETLEKEISDAIGAKDWAKEPSKLESESRTLKREIKTIVSEYTKKQKEISSVKGSINKLKGTIKKSEEVMEKDLAELKKTKDMIRVRLEKNGFKNIAEVEGILEEKINEKEEGVAINKFWKGLESATVKLEAVQKEAGTKKYDAKKHEKINEEVETLNDEKNDINQAIGELRNRIKEHTKNLSEKKRLEKNLEKMRIREGNIKILASLFRKNGFLDYVSTVYLQNFCKVANERFYRLTRQSMKLCLEEDNEFCVQDFMNEGKMRSIKTLSGGELFQASLSLAIALSDSIQSKFGNRQNFFFLDEGFGSQDKDSLQDVFYALKAMRNENRIVGIISHVEGLQEEIDTHLRTIKDEDTGSHIKESWKY